MRSICSRRCRSTATATQRARVADFVDKLPAVECDLACVAAQFIGAAGDEQREHVPFVGERIERDRNAIDFAD
jgi:hypothetical protein